MVEPVRMTLGADELAPMMSAFQWLAGFVQGSGREVPPHIEQQIATLGDWLKTVSPPREDRP